MSDVLIITQPILEDTDPTFFGRLTDAFGAAFQQADFQALGITLRVFVKEDGPQAQPIYTESGLSPTSLIFDVLQTTGWQADGDGYNFLHSPLVSALPGGGTTGGDVYVWEYELTRPGGLSPVWAIFVTPIASVMSS